MDAAARRLAQGLGRAARRISALAALAFAGPLFATGYYGPSARLDIVATPPSVTRSMPALPTYARYDLTITSLDRDRLKKFFFKGTVAVQGLPAGSTEQATLFSSDGASCTLSAAGALECAVPGELAYRGQSLTFSVTLKTPAAGSAIALAGKAYFFEYCCDWKRTESASASTELEAPDPNQFSSYVPASPTPTTLFSGANTQSGVVGAIPVVNSTAVPPLNDPFTTTIVVPAGSAASVANVAERELAQSCSANPRCFETNLRLPGSFSFLKIILRRDKTTLLSSSHHHPGGHSHHDDGKHGKGHDRDDDRYSGQSSIDNAIVRYYPDDDPANPERFIIVPNCSVVPGGLPTPKNPCIASRKAYPKKSSYWSPVPAGLEGDWEFVIHALDNGRYVN
jgi:hypothetical protein